MIISGGCFCGAVRYQFHEGEHPVANCHCSMCRKTSGAPFVTWLVIPAAQFEYTAGKPALLQSSDAGTRYFCDQCGTPVVCLSSKHPEIVDVTLGSVDHPEQFAPTMDVFTDTRLAWLHQD